MGSLVWLELKIMFASGFTEERHFLDLQGWGGLSVSPEKVTRVNLIA